VIAVFLISLITFGLTMYRGLPWAQSLRYVISLAVSAVPEGLPIAITVVLALGMRRLAHKKALVRNMRAIENIGLVTAIATDKTGTLTKNQLTVHEVWAPGTATSTLARQIAFAINHHQGVRADPLDEALYRWLKTKRIPSPQANLEQALPFDYVRAQSGNIYRQGRNLTAYIKGAPEKILAHVNLNPTHKLTLETTFHNFTSQGYRVLALAQIPLQQKVTKLAKLPPKNWRFVALLAVADELRPGIAQAVTWAKQAGVKIKMITGDHHETAWHIAAKIKIATARHEVYNSRGFANLSPTKKRIALEEANVFSRVLPEIKYQIISQLNQTEVTAMTGDGVNDVPALSKAHVAIAMGAGSQFAKEASDIVLLDNNFRTIVTALREGRIIVGNIRRMLVYLLSTNAGEVLVTVLALLLGLPLPVVAVQILWINLVTDTLIVIPLGLEPGDKNVMRRPPEPTNAPILNSFLLTRIILIATMVSLTVLGLFSYYRLTLDPAQANTIAFLALIATQLASAFALRSEQGFFGQGFGKKNNLFLGAILLTLVLQGAAFFTPLAVALHVTAIPWSAALLTIGLSLLIPIAAIELHQLYGHWHERQIP
jgi:Ca2+-transporting ATPase